MNFNQPRKIYDSNLNTYTMVVFWMSLASLPFLTNQHIFILHDFATIYHVQEQDILEKPSTMASIIGPLVDGDSSCESFPSIISRVSMKSPLFLLLRPSEKCNAETQLLNALQRGYSTIIYASNKAFSSREKFSLYKKVANSSFVFLIVSKEDASLLAAHTYDTSDFIYFSREKQFTLGRWIGLITIIVCIWIPISIFSIGKVYQFLRRKYVARRERRRVLTIPTRKCTEEDILETCPICIEEYLVDDVVTVLYCKHEFHQACLARWHGSKCPLCRSDMYATDVDRCPATNLVVYDSNTVSVRLSHRPLLSESCANMLLNESDHEIDSHGHGDSVSIVNI